MRRGRLAALLSVAALLAKPAVAGELKGPGRFCGYSPIIDLVAGERIETLKGGIHGGSFRWFGSFGVLDVHGVGWASPPGDRRAAKRTGRGHFIWDQRRTGKESRVAIWNGRHGAAYFSSPRRLTEKQLAAVDRVDLFEEGEEPQGCDLRTIFSWE